MISRKYYFAGSVCLFLGYQLLTGILFYGFYGIYEKHMGNFLFGHLITSITLLAGIWLGWYTIFILMMKQKADIRFCLPVLALGGGSCVLMILLRIATVCTPFWITLLLYCIAVILSVLLVLLAVAGAEHAL